MALLLLDAARIIDPLSKLQQRNEKLVAAAATAKGKP
jgi:hypothetical protein